MTIDEAIKHAEEVAEEQESNAHVHKNMMVFRQNIKHNILAKLHEESMNVCIECAEEHRQLAEWLKELKRLREQANVPDKNVGDLISRQDAINALWKALYEYEDKTEKQFIESDELNVADWIEHRIFVQNMSDIDRQTILSLPSEQPEKRTEERTKTHACDCISRQAAIDALSHMMDTDGFRDGWAVSRANVDCMLRYLPSVEPERKTGKWIKVVNPDTNEWTGGFKCSECDRGCVQMSMNFCANCGAPMEVDG